MYSFFAAVILGSVLVILILGTATYVCRYVPKVATSVCKKYYVHYVASNVCIYIPKVGTTVFWYVYNFETRYYTYACNFATNVCRNVPNTATHVSGYVSTVTCTKLCTIRLVSCSISS
jgi:hypothetical protein